MLTPQQAAAKWQQKAGAASADYKTGVMGVTSAPGAAAVAAQNVMSSNWNNAVNSGLWAQRTGGVTLQQWQQAASTKGAQNYATGVAAGSAKMQAAMSYYLPVAAAVKEAVKSIPRDGGAGSLARVQLAMEAFKQAKANRR
jgi:hypothetical protein